MKNTAGAVCGLQLVNLNVDLIKMLVVPFFTINKLTYKKNVSIHLEIHLSLMTDIPNTIINENESIKESVL